MTRLGEAASGVADAITLLQRLTLGRDDQLAGPGDVREVVGSLSLAMARMPRLLEQLAVFLEVEYVKGAVAAGPEGRAEEGVRAVSDALHRASQDAEAMAAALDAAREACDRIRRSDPGPRTDAGPGIPRGRGTRRRDDR